MLKAWSQEWVCISASRRQCHFQTEGFGADFALRLSEIRKHCRKNTSGKDRLWWSHSPLRSFSYSVNTYQANIWLRPREGKRRTRSLLSGSWYPGEKREDCRELHQVIESPVQIFVGTKEVPGGTPPWPQLVGEPGMGPTWEVPTRMGRGIRGRKS